MLHPFSQALPLFLDRLADPVTAVILSVTVVLIFGELYYEDLLLDPCMDHVEAHGLNLHVLPSR